MLLPPATKTATVMALRAAATSCWTRWQSKSEILFGFATRSFRSSFQRATTRRCWCPTSCSNLRDILSIGLVCAKRRSISVLIQSIISALLKGLVDFQHVLYETLRTIGPLFQTKRQATDEAVSPEGAGASGKDPVLVPKGTTVQLHRICQCITTQSSGELKLGSLSPNAGSICGHNGNSSLSRADRVFALR